MDQPHVHVFLAEGIGQSFATTIHPRDVPPRLLQSNAMLGFLWGGCVLQQCDAQCPSYNESRITSDVGGCYYTSRGTRLRSKIARISPLPRAIGRGSDASKFAWAPVNELKHTGPPSGPRRTRLDRGTSSCWLIIYNAGGPVFGLNPQVLPMS